MKEIESIPRKDITGEALEPIPEHILLKRELVHILEGSVEAYEEKRIHGLKLFLEALRAWNRANEDPFLNLAIQIELEKKGGVFNGEREIVEQDTIEALYNPLNWASIIPEQLGTTPREFILHRVTCLKELLEGLFKDERRR